MYVWYSLRNVECYISDMFFDSNASIITVLLDENYFYSWEHSGSVVECLTRDRRATGSSLTGVTVLCP